MSGKIDYDVYQYILQIKLNFRGFFWLISSAFIDTERYDPDPSIFIIIILLF